MNIVFSQTKQWNPGDELILEGIRSLIPKEHTFILFNRHPFMNFKNRPGDNSYYYGMGNEIVDHIIFAGSPEYQTAPNNDIYSLINSHNVPFSYIGVGGKQHINRPFEKAKLSLCRDSAAAKMPNGIVLPCPSIFANRNLELTPTKKKEKVTFCFQTNLNYICSPTKNAHKVAVDFIDNHDMDVVCHSYPDYVEATRRGWNAFYTSDSSEYHEYYKQYDLIIGTRIHGSGWGANYGIPSITIEHDDRIETAKNFGSVVCKPNIKELEQKFNEINVEEESNKIINIRKETIKKYLEYMVPIFGIPEWFKKEL